MNFNNKNVFVLLLLLNLLFSFQNCLFSQPVTQTLKGKVLDSESNMPLIGATVVILNTDPLKGTATNAEGNFRIDSVAVGRYNISVSYIGYQPYIAREIVVSSGREAVLHMELKESVEDLKEVTVKAYSDKDEPINSMATLSARQVNMEEANRYAGGFDDPARLVSSYAGVASAVGNNGVVIRGNSPKGLLWRMEGVQIPNPNHFADYISLGGGAVTALSSQTMATSDFFTGAYPAEYGNALSGVFDINMRTGNIEKREHVFQAGLVGIDFASEGPFKKGERASYLFNYRYSTLGLLAPILPKEMGKLTYQDLSFKLNFPTKAGTFSLWGIGAYDFQGNDAESDSAKWESSDDCKELKTKLTMAAIGLNYKKIVGNSTYVQTTLALTENSLDWSEKRYDNNMSLLPNRKVTDFQWKYTFTGFVNHKFGAKHTNRTGFIIDRMMYDIQIENSEESGDPLQTYVSERNGSNLLRFYSQSKFTPFNKLTINAGVHAQYFTMNGNFTIEPRIGARWNFLPRHTFSLAYGFHSQLEKMQLYLVEYNTASETILPNKNLDFNKAHHFIFAYEVQFNQNLHLKVEPYYQWLFDIPVVPDSYISTINLHEIWDFDDMLVNKGSGRNIGMDVTLERFLDKGYYYLFTASIFDSRYTGGDGIERNTRYNKKYVFNALGGKEWQTGKDNQNLFNANIRFTYMGGDRIIPLDVAATMEQQKIVEDVNQAYEQQLPDAPILSLSFSYRKNKPGHSSVWSFHLINALGYKDFQEYEFDVEAMQVKKKEDMLLIPNLSYKLEF